MSDHTRSKRLLLRRPNDGDLPAIYAIHADPETNRYNPSGPDTEEGARRKLDKWREHWETHGFGYWAICLAEAPHEVIGFGGIMRSVVGARHGLNLYFRFKPQAWGKGYAGEMAQAALHLAFDELGETEVLAKTRPTNLPSRKSLERLGLREIDIAHDIPGALPSLIYCLSAPQYRHTATA